VTTYLVGGMTPTNVFFIAKFSPPDDKIIIWKIFFKENVNLTKFTQKMEKYYKNFKTIKLKDNKHYTQHHVLRHCSF
jgi:hypothetical protein